MPSLVGLAEVLDFLGGDADAAVVGPVLDQLEALFNAATGRRDAPFAAASTDPRTEYLPGTGTGTLYLDYPVGTLTSVILGQNPADPAETLTIADPNLLNYAAGSRTLVRVDGGWFGPAGLASYVQVVYHPAADLPAEAAIAIKHAVAKVFRGRGSEDASAETVGQYTRDAAAFLEADGLWTIAVAACSRPALMMA